MIKLSKKGDYALKALVYIKKNSEINLKIKNISLDLEISESLLRRIIAELEKSGIIKTIKGRNGGIKLNKIPSKISLLEIFNAVGEETGITTCTKGEFCKNKECCDTTGILNSLQNSINSLLKIYTLDKIK